MAGLPCVASPSPWRASPDFSPRSAILSRAIGRAGLQPRRWATVPRKGASAPEAGASSSGEHVASAAKAVIFRLRVRRG